MKVKKEFGDRVELDWFDSVSESDWVEEDEVKRMTSKISLCHTLGFFIRQNKDFIFISHTIGKNDNGKYDMIGVFMIPKKCIRKVK